MRFPLPIRSWLVLVLSLWPSFVASVYAQGTLKDPLEGFYAPAAAVFSRDGAWLFVTNSARTDFGMLAGRGAVSRVRVGADGQLTMDKAKFVEGLSAPMGVAILPTALGEIPAGSVVVATGGRWAMKNRETRIDDPKERETGLLFFDPSDGRRLGAAYLGAGSAIETVLGQPVLDPGNVVFDSAGNVFIADVAGMGLKQETGDYNRPGVIRISAAAMTSLLRGEDPARDGITFLSVPEVAGGIAWSENDDRFYWATNAGAGDLVGAVLYIEGGSFGPDGRVTTVHTDLQPLVGACVTSKGSLLVVHVHGVVGVIKGGKGKVRSIKFRDRTVFLSPGQPAATTLADGKVLVVVPEMASGGRPAWRHRVQSFLLPAGY